MSTSPAGLDVLPAEIRLLILSSVPDIPTLVSLALSCKAFYQSLRSIESRVKRDVLLRQVGADVMPDAMACLESSIRRPFSRRKLEEFVTYVVDSDAVGYGEGLDPSISLKQALRISKLHHYVEHLSVGLMKENNLGDGDGEGFYPDRCTDRDSLLIRQTLYRLEIHRNIIRDGNARTRAALSKFYKANLREIHGRDYWYLTLFYAQVAFADVLHTFTLDGQAVVDIVKRMSLKELYDMSTAESQEQQQGIIKRVYPEWVNLEDPQVTMDKFSRQDPNVYCDMLFDLDPEDSDD